jgi:hypothetical protein
MVASGARWEKGASARIVVHQHPSQQTLSAVQMIPTESVQSTACDQGSPLPFATRTDEAVRVPVPDHQVPSHVCPAAFVLVQPVGTPYQYLRACRVVHIGRGASEGWVG